MIYVYTLRTILEPVRENLRGFFSLKYTRVLPSRASPGLSFGPRCSLFLARSCPPFFLFPQEIGTIEPAGDRKSQQAAPAAAAEATPVAVVVTCGTGEEIGRYVWVY